METTSLRNNSPSSQKFSSVPDNSKQQHLHVDEDADVRQAISISEVSENKHSTAVNHEMDSRNDTSDEDPVESDSKSINIGDIKEAWADDSAGQTDFEAEANIKSRINKVDALLSGIEAEASKTTEEERIRELLAYMEGENRRQESECRKLKGTHLEDINEAEEDTISVSVDSRPSTRQHARRPSSGRSSRSQPRGSRSRPVSARSGTPSGIEHMNGFEEDNDFPDPPNLVRSENWYMPSRPPSVIERNQAAGITLESGGKYRISLPSDTEKNLISGITFLDNGDLVLADKGNQKMKFVDKEFVFISQLSVPEPWDVCSVGNEVYVTFGTNTVQNMFIRDMVLNMGKTFEMTDKCFGIANFNNGLAVGLKYSEIHLMNLQGEVKRIIKIPKTEKGRKMCPWHLSITNKFDILVTDPTLRYMCCINSKGELLFSYPDMSNPRATISDSAGNIFLVGLNKDTELVMQILRKSGQTVICVKSIAHLEDVEFEPNSISLRQSDGLLVLGGMRHALKRYRIV